MLPRREPILALCVLASVFFTVWISGGPAAAAEGGPDGFGYRFKDSLEPDGPAYDFDDISGIGNPVVLGDDQVSGPIPLGFDFSFYGRVYTSVYVSSNGFLTFLEGQGSGCCTGLEMPTAYPPNALIAGWWEDLNPLLGGSITYETLGTGRAQRFILQLTDIQHYGAGNPVTLQYKLFAEDGRIEVHYQAAPSDTGTHSAGIENQGGTVGLQYRWTKAALTTPLAVQYTFSPRVPPGVLKLLLLDP